MLLRCIFLRHSAFYGSSICAQSGKSKRKRCLTASTRLWRSNNFAVIGVPTGWTPTYSPNSG